jgi:hypothetical protein
MAGNKATAMRLGSYAFSFTNVLTIQSISTPHRSVIRIAKNRFFKMLLIKMKQIPGALSTRMRHVNARYCYMGAEWHQWEVDGSKSYSIKSVYSS